MMQIHDGSKITLVAPAGGVTGGEFYNAGGLFGVVAKTAAAGETFVLDVGGVYDVACTLTAAVAAGDALRLNGQTLVDAGPYPMAAIALEAKTDAATSIRVLLLGELSATDLVFVGGSATPSSVAAETVVMTATIPADTLRVGDQIEIDARAEDTATTSTETSTARTRVGGVSGVIAAATAAVDTADNDLAMLTGKAWVEAIGASGSIIAQGLGAWDTAGAVFATPSAAGTVDTTDPVTVVGTAQHSSTGNTTTFNFLKVRVRRAK